MNETADAGEAGNGLAFFGVLSILLGFLCLLAPGVTGVSVLTLLGVLVLLGGIVRMLWAFTAGSLGNGPVAFAIGGLTLLCGIALIGNPWFASGVLTVILAVYFITDGVAELAAGCRLRPLPGWGWMVFGGGVSVLLGVMIWRQYPLSGVRAMGSLVGIKLFFVGLTMATTGSAVRAKGPCQE